MGHAARTPSRPPGPAPRSCRRCPCCSVTSSRPSPPAGCCAAARPGSAAADAAVGARGGRDSARRDPCAGRSRWRAHSVRAFRGYARHGTARPARVDPRSARAVRRRAPAHGDPARSAGRPARARRLTRRDRSPSAYPGSSDPRVRVRGRAAVVRHARVCTVSPARPSSSPIRRIPLRPLGPQDLTRSGAASVMKVSRIAAAGAVAGATVLVLSGPAFAHVSVSAEGTAAKGGYATVNFKVPNERDNASTTKLEVSFPTDHPLASVMPQPVAGWTVKVTKSQAGQAARDARREDHRGRLQGHLDRRPARASSPASSRSSRSPSASCPRTPTSSSSRRSRRTPTRRSSAGSRSPKDGAEEPENPAPVLALSAATGDHATAPPPRSRRSPPSRPPRRPRPPPPSPPTAATPPPASWASSASSSVSRAWRTACSPAVAAPPSDTRSPPVRAGGVRSSRTPPVSRTPLSAHRTFHERHLRELSYAQEAVRRVRPPRRGHPDPLRLRQR